jgi:predicted NAD/FAD-binding protein
MKIAIVGAGVSGLVAAHLLHREHELVIYDAATYAGGHTNTVRVDTKDATHQVDTGFIAFNERNYPKFTRLLAELGVASQLSNMSFGVSDGLDFEYSGASPNGLFANRAHLVKPWFHRMVADLLRFNRREFCVTLNRTEAIDPAKVLRTIPYAHPVFTSAGARAQARHEEISGAHQRTHFCGAYWG